MFHNNVIITSPHDLTKAQYPQLFLFFSYPTDNIYRHMNKMKH